MWRGGCRSNISVAAPFVWRCLTGSALAPFPHPAHRTWRADFPLSHCPLWRQYRSLVTGAAVFDETEFAVSWRIHTKQRNQVLTVDVGVAIP